MLPFFDAVQIHRALHNQALPVIDALATNQDLRDRALSRFERDDPPPYESSTESEDFEPAVSYESRRNDPLPDDVKAIMDPPLTDDERHIAASSRPCQASPIDVYHRECKLEELRLSRIFYLTYFRGERGNRRFGVLIRRNVKRRMQKLGVWNSDWGFPGRNAQPNDNAHHWDWWWQQESPNDPSLGDERELTKRALSLRQNLRRGESAPTLPRSSLHPGATASQAQSFIMSRPWFSFLLEVAEEKARSKRFDDADQQWNCMIQARRRVVQWWRERGDWRDEFDEGRLVSWWKWRHESPSPEPEDMSRFEPGVGNDHIDPLDHLELTPSEIDALEVIDLPSSEQPKKFWAVYDGDCPPYFPGHMVDTTGGRSPPPRMFRPGPEDASPPEFLLFSKSETQPPLESPTPSEEPRQGTFKTPAQGRSRRQPRSLRRQEADMDLNKSTSPPPPPRRSARIAAMKRSAEQLPPQTVSNKRSRLTGTTPTAQATAPQPAARETRRTRTGIVPARAPASTEQKPRLSRGRGRPSSGSRPGTSTAVAKKKKTTTKKETPPTTRTRSGRGRRA